MGAQMLNKLVTKSVPIIRIRLQPECVLKYLANKGRKTSRLFLRIDLTKYRAKLWVPIKNCL